MAEDEGQVQVADLASTGLLSFYDRLRRRMTDFADQRTGRPGRGVLEVLLLAPDLFILLVRLSLDRNVPSESRRWILGALAYFLTPVDLLPEALLGPVGYLEDVVLASAVLSVALGPDLEPAAEAYWSGSQRLRRVLGEISAGAYNLLGHNLYVRVQRFLARRGIELR